MYLKVDSDKVWIGREQTGDEAGNRLGNRLGNRPGNEAGNGLALIAL